VEAAVEELIALRDGFTPEEISKAKSDTCSSGN
jgi:hypothetical protein